LIIETPKAKPSELLSITEAPEALEQTPLLPLISRSVDEANPELGRHKYRCQDPVETPTDEQTQSSGKSKSKPPRKPSQNKVQPGQPSKRLSTITEHIDQIDHHKLSDTVHDMDEVVGKQFDITKKVMAALFNY
jgi:hypothetical protein